jgi:hypothetical protein
MNTTHASAFICLPPVWSGWTTILAAFARVPMKGGIFFKFRASELRDENGFRFFVWLGQDFHQRKDGGLLFRTTLAVQLFLMDRCDAETIWKATIRCGSNGIVMS